MKDRFHNVVCTALTKEGWNITHDPLALKVGGVEMEIDLGAERFIGAERGGEKIAVEIKSFLAHTSAISEFHRALGQYLNYRSALQKEEPDRVLFLAVPEITYGTFFQLDFPKSMVEDFNLKLLIYEIASEEVVLWKN